MSGQPQTLPWRLSITTTTACNLDCPGCAARPVRRAFPDYHVSREELHRFIERCRELNVQYKEIVLSGGEPTIWKHFISGVRLLKSAGVTKELWLYTNAVEIGPLREVLDLFDEVRVSIYPGVTHHAAELSLHPHVTCIRPVHRWPPQKPLTGVLPAVCNCPHQGLFNGRLYRCSPAASRALMLGLDPESPDISCDVEDDFVAHFRRHQTTRKGSILCRVCISNSRVFQQCALVH